MRDGFVARADAVSRLLRDVRTTFVVVTTLEAVPAVEAEQLIESLRERRLHLGLLVCNRVLPGSFSDPPVGRTAELLGQRSGELAESLAPRLLRAGAASSPPATEMVARVLNEVARSFANFRLVATREAELLEELSAAHEVTAAVPYHPGHVTDLRGLLDVGSKIWGDEADVSTGEVSPTRTSKPRRHTTGPDDEPGSDAPARDAR
jgi:anion-transporting  ArsA/GET3 family ATPase